MGQRREGETTGTPGPFSQLRLFLTLMPSFFKVNQLQAFFPAVSQCHQLSSVFHQGTRHHQMKVSSSLLFAHRLISFKILETFNNYLKQQHELKGKGLYFRVARGSTTRLINLWPSMRTSYPPSSVNAPFDGYSKLWLHGTEESRDRRRSNDGDRTDHPPVQKAAHQPTELRLLT